MNKQRLIFFIKLLILVAILCGVTKFVYKAWSDLNKNAAAAHIPIPWNTFDWRFSFLAVLAFAGVMLISGFTWRWLAFKMGDRTSPLRTLGAYTFSQMGKYVPGKIALLLMRIDRAGRFGMTHAICTLSTLLENALYMISGGLVGMLAIAHVVRDLPPKVQPFIWPATILAILLLASACHPTIFYTLVNKLLAKMKKPIVPCNERLRLPTLLLAVLAFTPCWILGGLALWASASCVHPLPITDSGWFIGAFSLSVIFGMASLIPGGGGVRDAILGAAVALQFATLMDRNHAVLLGTLVAILQRLFQLVAEVLLGLTGSFLTRKPGPSISEKKTTEYLIP